MLVGDHFLIRDIGLSGIFIMCVFYLTFAIIMTLRAFEPYVIIFIIICFHRFTFSVIIDGQF
jgi:hypothetical protein